LQRRSAHFPQRRARGRPSSGPAGHLLPQWRTRGEGETDCCAHLQLKALFLPRSPFTNTRHSLNFESRRSIALQKSLSLGSPLLNPRPVRLRWGKAGGVRINPPDPDSPKFIEAVEILPNPRYQHLHENFERSKLVAGQLLAAFRLCAFGIWTMWPQRENRAAFCLKASGSRANEREPG
jgi:hypothetical protein